MQSTHQITMLLKAWKEGDAEALNRLVPLADRELRNIARGYMANERRNHILQPTALVNEAWAKLFRENKAVEWKNRKHFYALLALRMRQVLINYAHRERPIELTGKILSDEQSAELLALDQALEKLRQVNKRWAEVVELRFFGGNTIEKVAEILGVGSATVQRDWRFAKSFLWNELTRSTERSH